MVMACVLARVQSQGKKLEELSKIDIDELVADAISDLQLAESIVVSTISASH
jgi:hypothetical protein